MSWPGGSISNQQGGKAGIFNLLLTELLTEVCVEETGPTYPETGHSRILFFLLLGRAYCIARDALELTWQLLQN